MDGDLEMDEEMLLTVAFHEWHTGVTLAVKALAECFSRQDFRTGGSPALPVRKLSLLEVEIAPGRRKAMLVHWRTPVSECSGYEVRMFMD